MKMLLVISPLVKVRTPVSPLESTDLSSSGTLDSSMRPCRVSEPSSSNSERSMRAYLSRSRSALIQSMGRGKMMVEFFSAAISVRVCR